MGTPKKNKAFERIRSLRATTWPDAKPKVIDPETGRGPVALLEANSLALWQSVAKGESMLGALGGPDKNNGLLTYHVLLVAYRVSRGLAIAGGLASPKSAHTLGGLNQDDWARSLGDFRGSPTDSATLDPAQGGIEPFADVLRVVAPRLKVHFGGPDHMIMQWFLEDPLRVGIAWPNPEDLVSFEADIVDQVRNRIENAGRQIASRYLTLGLGMSRGEADDLMGAVVAGFAAMGRIDPDAERGILLSRVERFYRRARKMDDLREEGNALKLHAQLAGLTREIPQAHQEEVDFVGAIERVVARDGPPVKPPPPPITVEATYSRPALPAPQED